MFWLLLLIIIPSVNAINISGCSDLNTNNAVYNLTADIWNTYDMDCMYVTGYNIILDCGNHLIDGMGTTDSYGVFIQSSYENMNFTVRNCHIEDFYACVNIEASYNVTIYNNSFRYCYDGISEYDSRDIRVDKNIFRDISYRGYDGWLGSKFNITNSYFQSVSDLAIFLVGDPSGNGQSIVSNVTIVDSTNGINLYSHNNYVANVTCLNANNCIRVEGYSNNTIVDVYAETSTFALIWLLAGARNTKIINVTLTGTTDVGIWLEGVYNTTITRLKAINNNWGMSISGDTANTTLNDSIIAGNDVGIYHFDIASTTSRNYFYNNLFNNTVNVQFDTTINTGSWNTTKREGARIFSAGNLIGGNFWDIPSGTGFSESCTDNNDDGFCDSSYTVGTSNIDMLPLSNKYYPYKTIVGSPFNWTWKIPSVGDYVISGQPFNWTWRLYEPGSGRRIPKGEPFNWTWRYE